MSASPVPVLELRAPARLLTELTDCLARTGLGVASTSQPSGLVVQVHEGALPADATDDLVRQSRPHLLLGLHRRHVDLGPFVDPGLTACLHCLYAARACVLAAPSALPPPDDPVHGPGPSLLAIAAALVAHDVRRWASGDEPATWSATVRVDTTLQVTRFEWLRHPQCGCTWSLPAC